MTTPKKYTARYYEDYTFIFKYDPDATDMLHIWVRHLTEPEDAMRTFFEGITTWNEAKKRFETASETHIVYWLWLDEEHKTVMVITCFTL